MICEAFGTEFMVFDFPFPCEIHYRMPMRVEFNDNYRVLILSSEPSMLCTDVDTLRSISHFFDLIITSNPRLFDLPNVAKDFFGDIWVNKLPNKKEFSASFIFSLGANMPGITGYAERRGFIENTDKITMPLRLYRGRRPYEGNLDLPLLVDDRKECLFESMFHVSIENQSETNYFSEKVVDCFATYTVPIYIGCTNIGDFFDTDGMIIARSAAEVIDILNGLTVKDYWSRMAAMDANFKTSKNYWNWSGRIRNIILQRWQATHGAGI